MSPAPRKKKDEEAPTAAEVEEQVSEEAGKSVPRAEDDATVEETPAAEVEEVAEDDKPAKPARKPRAKKAAPKADADEPSEDDTPAADEPVAEEKPKRGRKKAEPDEKPAKPARKRDQPRAKRQPGEPAVLVSAKARYVRTSARKARLVCDHIRGKDVEQARAILSFTPRSSAKPWLKLLE